MASPNDRTVINDPSTFYSGESFFAGFNIITYVSTFMTAGPLALSKKSRFYSVLTLIAAGRLAHVSIHTAACAQLAMSASSAIPIAVLDWICSVAFITLKMHWLYRAASDKFPNTVKALTVFVAASNAIATASWIYNMIEAGNTGTVVDPVAQPGAWTLYAVWLLWSSVAHAAISAVFCILIKDGPKSHQKEQGTGIVALLSNPSYQYWFLIGFEAFLVVLTHWGRALAPDFDPQNASTLVADALRLRIYCAFYRKFASTFVKPGDTTSVVSSSAAMSKMSQSGVSSQAGEQKKQLVSQK